MSYASDTPASRLGTVAGRYVRINTNNRSGGLLARKLLTALHTFSLALVRKYFEGASAFGYCLGGSCEG